MTKEQVDILSTHLHLRGPILLSGEAGSGKTIVMTHWLLINQLRKIEPQLFVTFSNRLVESTRDTFEKMLPSDGGSHQVRFLTYRDLLLEIANTGGLKPRDPSKEMTFERFIREYSKNVSPEIDYVLLWDEIRSTIKGACTDPNRRMIDYSTYEQLNEKKGLCKVPKEMREKYYHQAQLYQNYLDKHGLWDAIDLALDCLRCVDKISPYAKIACDEVQDLAPVEIIVLINIVKDKNIDNIFFTGDIAQVINPSGFTWSRLKGLLGEISKRHDIRDAWTLGRNFRSTKEIVELVNEILCQRKNILDDGERNIQHSYISSGIKPMVLDMDPLKILKETTSNPKERLILVKTKEEKNHLMDILNEAVEKITILTVEEAKGLEWEGVLLWNFFIPRHEKITKNDWENVFIPEKRRSFAKLVAQGKKNPYGLIYEFNLLHVGLTRARKYLFMYDESNRMNIKNLGESIAKKITPIDLNQFRVHWETTLPSPEQVYKLALDLLDRDQKQAFAFFRIAAQGFEENKKFEKAAECYERISEYKLAAECYKKENNILMQEKMLALDAESRKNFEEAGKHWEEYSEYARKNQDWKTAADGYNSAAKAYENAGLFEKAAESSEKRAECYGSIEEIKYRINRAESFYDAATLWEKSNNIENAVKDLLGAINIVRDEIIKSDKTHLINGKTPQIWLAEAFAQLANYEIKDEKTLEAAQHFMDTAKWFKEAEKKAGSDSEKENYFELQIIYLQKAVDLFKKIGKIDIALNVMKD
ncbi:MAG: AAA family ATPase, partial [Candidatus Korarchaeota archaeon]|nr:AAA family ATPase [Candidatus Korarchaeota archaeon]